MKHYFRIVVYLFASSWFSSSHAGAFEDFFRAINIDNDRTVKSLLAQGFDPNTVDEKGQCGLYLAMREDAPKVAAALLAHPAIKIDAANAVGETPLMMAALRGRLEWTQRLIERGAQVQREGWAPLHYAASGPEPKVVALLLDRGASIDAPAPNRTTALMMAARYGDEASADLLIARGANPKLRNDRELGAADFARLGGRDKLAEKLDRLAR
jgi:ankyrin repeat protein